MRAMAVAAMMALLAGGAEAGKEPGVTEQLDTALNAGNVDAAAALFSDDAAVTDPFGGAAQGKEQVRSWLTGLVTRKFHADSGVRQDTGDGSVRWVSSIADDRLRALKIAPLEATGIATVRGGKIVSFTPRLSAASQLKLRDAVIAANKAVARELIEQGFGANGDAVVDRLVAPDYQDHDPFPNQPGTREGLKGGMASLREAFPDLTATVEDAVAEGDRVAARFVLKGTNTGLFMGRTATGKAVAFEALHVFRIADGKIAEAWGVADRAGLREQLEPATERGVPPLPSSTAAQPTGPPPAVPAKKPVR